MDPAESGFSKELHEEAYEILSSNDVKPMETLFSHMFSTVEPQRSQAFSMLTYCKEKFPSLLFIKLCFLLGNSDTITTRTNAAKVLNVVQVRDLWHALSSNAKSNLKSLFLKYLRQENFLSSVKVVCRVVADMTCEIYSGEDKWPELLDFLVSSLKSGNEKFQESAFLVFSYLPKKCRVLISGTLTFQFEVFDIALLNALTSRNADVKVSANCALLTLIYIYSGPSKQNKFRDLMKAMITGVYDLLCRSLEEKAQEVMNNMITLVTEEPYIFKLYVKNFALEMVNIADSRSLKVETKCIAAKFLMTLMELKPLATEMVNLPNPAVAGLFSISMKMLLCIKDDTAWYQMKCREGENEGENAGKTDIYDFGIKFLSQISITFNQKFIVSVAFKLLSVYMGAPEWQKRHAGITMLAELSKECSYEMVMTGNYMEQAVTNIMRSFLDIHPRVCWAAFNFLQLHTDFVQVAQILHHPRIVPALAATLDKNENTRVKEQAAYVMLCFIKNIPPDNLTVYMDLNDIMRKLDGLLQIIDKTVKGRSIVLSTFNSFAQQYQDVAIKHYARFIPTIIEACDDENSLTKQEATRGIRICAEFGGTKFKPFIKSVISKLNAVLHCPDRTYSEDVKTFEVAVSALGKICEFHRDNVDAAKLLPAWLNLLPLKNDLTEAKIAHEQLCFMVEKTDKDLLGPCYQNLPKIIAVFLEVCKEGNDLATGETIHRMTNLLKHIFQTFPNGVLNHILSELNPEQHQLLKSVVFP